MPVGELASVLGRPYRATDDIQSCVELDPIALMFGDEAGYVETSRVFLEDGRVTAIWVHHNLVC